MQQTKSLTQAELGRPLSRPSLTKHLRTYRAMLLYILLCIIVVDDGAPAESI